MLDEAQVIRDDREREGKPPLSLLIAAVNTLQEKEKPVGLTLCGLPTLRANLLKARTYTEHMFGVRRSADWPEARPSRRWSGRWTDGASAEDGLIGRVVDEVEGYPFFIQLWGAELWEAAQLAGVDHFDVSLWTRSNRTSTGASTSTSMTVGSNRSLLPSRIC